MGVKQIFKPQITRTDLRTGTVELPDNYQGKPFVGPNDVTIDGKGRLYFTDLPGGAVYRLDGPGQPTTYPCGQTERSAECKWPHGARRSVLT